MKIYINSIINTLTKQALWIVMVITGVQIAYSQQHQFSFAAGGLFSNINYELKSGEIKHGYGVDVGVRYAYYFNPNISIGVGVEYQNFNSSLKIDLAKDSYTTTDNEGEQFEFRYNARGLNESHSVQYITIPLTIQFEGTGYPGFYASVGAKMGFAMKGKYESTIDNLSTSGYYSQYDAELFDPQFAGFGNFGKISQGEQDLDFNMSYIATVEGGIKRYINTTSALYIGLYLDYGLNNILEKDGDTPIVEYKEKIPVNFSYNSVLESTYTKDVKLMAYGIKVRYAIW